MIWIFHGLPSIHGFASDRWSGGMGKDVWFLEILLMVQKSGDHQLGCMRYLLHQLATRISSINSMKGFFMEKWKTLTLFGDCRCRWVLNDLLSRDCWKYWHLLRVQIQQFCVLCDGMYTEAPHLIRFTVFFTTTMMRSCVLQAES